jgi:hypothetical protein
MDEINKNKIETIDFENIIRENNLKIKNLQKDIEEKEMN